MEWEEGKFMHRTLIINRTIATVSSIGNGRGRAGYDSKNWKRIQSFTTRYTTVHFNASGNPWWNDFMVVPRIYSRRSLVARPSRTPGRTFGLQASVYALSEVQGARRRLNRNIDSRRSLVVVPKFHYTASFVREQRASHPKSWKGVVGGKKDRGESRRQSHGCHRAFSRANHEDLYICPIKLHAVLIQGTRDFIVRCHTGIWKMSSTWR